MEKYVIAALVVAAVYITVKSVKNQLFKKLQGLVESKNYTEFFACVDSGIAQIMISGFEREILKLSVFIRQDNKGRTEEQFHSMEEMKKSPGQECDFLAVGFHYFLKNSQKEKCREIIEKMKKIMPDNQIAQYQQCLCKAD